MDYTGIYMTTLHDLKKFISGDTDSVLQIAANRSVQFILIPSIFFYIYSLFYLAQSEKDKAAGKAYVSSPSPSYFTEYQ